MFLFVSVYSVPHIKTFYRTTSGHELRPQRSVWEAVRIEVNIMVRLSIWLFQVKEDSCAPLKG